MTPTGPDTRNAPATEDGAQTAGHAPTLRPTLTLVYGPDRDLWGAQLGLGPKPLPLDRMAPVIEGRTLSDADASRQHAQVARRPDGRYAVCDLGSRNGTLVNGQRVPAAGVALEEGDVVRIGGTLFLFHRAAPAGSSGQGEPSELLGHGAVAEGLRATVRRYAVGHAPVLVLGESGTGKELVAQALGRLGRPGRRVLSASLADSPTNLVDDRLFGHVKGAFSGADRPAPGLFREASGGTLFLDEIGEASPEIQAKLLRVLQEGLVTPLGATREEPVDVRLIAATNRSLSEAAAEGRFRADLYARLAHLVITVPPLRERLEDVPLLADHFLRKAAGAGRLSAAAVTRLVRHTWPLNVRELAAIVATAAAEWPGSGPVELGPNVRQRLDEHVAHFGLGANAAPDETAVRDALARARGNMTEAAKLLGKDRAHLYRIVRRFGLEPGEFRG